ncbi:hypothetical protein EV426DRAFT_146513 [Tirmania nivea]|nr:hypothetical protein EV426DRAFT_146513 [Tirmania nivea]
MSNNKDMDWAAIAAKGAHQSPDEARAPPVDTIIPNESASTSSLVDVDSGVTVVPPDFLERPIKTETQATRIELEEGARVAAQENQSHHNKQQNGKRSKKTPTKKQVRKAVEWNSVQVVNTVLGAVAAVALGWGAWRRYKMGELSWGLVGIWGAGVAAVGVLDVVATRLYLDSKKGGH